MDTKFTLQIEVTLDERHASKLIKTARQAYKAHGASGLVDGKEQAIPAEKFISCAEQALMELVEENPLFESRGYASMRFRAGVWRHHTKSLSAQKCCPTKSMKMNRVFTYAAGRTGSFL